MHMYAYLSVYVQSCRVHTLANKYTLELASYRGSRIFSISRTLFYQNTHMYVYIHIYIFIYLYTFNSSPHSFCFVGSFVGGPRVIFPTLSLPITITITTTTTIYSLHFLTLALYILQHVFPYFHYPLKYSPTISHWFYTPSNNHPFRDHYFSLSFPSFPPHSLLVFFFFFYPTTFYLYIHIKLLTTATKAVLSSFHGRYQAARRNIITTATQMKFITNYTKSLDDRAGYICIDECVCLFVRNVREMTCNGCYWYACV